MEAFKVEMKLELQFVQTIDPEFAANDPGEHGAHGYVDAALTLLDVPDGQAEQVDEPPDNE